MKVRFFAEGDTEFLVYRLKDSSQEMTFEVISKYDGRYLVREPNGVQCGIFSKRAYGGFLAHDLDEADARQRFDQYLASATRPFDLHCPFCKGDPRENCPRCGHS
jgi:hypothetical protein